MKMVRDTIIMSEEMNPRGGQAKPLEATAKRAAWLSVMCGYWLSHNGDDQRLARANEPTYNLPKAFPGGERFNKARKLCDAYTPAARVEGGLRPSLTSDGKLRNVEGPVHRPTYASRWVWADVFDYWLSGGLDRGVENLMEMLPEQNVEAIRKEMLK